MAGRIPQSFIQELLDRSDIVALIEQRMTLKKTGKNYTGLCPFHDEKTPSFSVSPDKQLFHCFGCQESGTALSFLMKHDRLEFVDAVETLAANLGLEVPREQGGISRRRVDSDLYEIMARAERYYRDCLRTSSEAIDYLKGRGLTGEIARDFGIGFAPDGWRNLSEHLKDVPEQKLLAAGLINRSDKGRVYDRFRHRIMFPIRDIRGRIIAFGGRVITGDDGPKYLNSPETEIFHKGRELYGLFEARKALRSISRLVVVEGYMDVVALAQNGVAYTVATLGTATGSAHFEKLFRYTDEVICCFDGDQAGRQAAWKALDNALATLNENRQLKFVFLSDGEDPDTVVRQKGRQHLEQLFANAQPALELLFQRMSQGLDLTTIDGKARFSGLIQPYLDKVAPGVLKSLMQARVVEMTGLRSPSVRQPAAPGATAMAVNSDKVSERLLSVLIRHPELWQKLPEALRRDLLTQSELGLAGELMSFLQTHEDADPEELLVRFAVGENEAAVLDAARKPLGIPADTVLSELNDLCRRVLRNSEEKKRKEALLKLKDSPNIEALRKYWSQHGGRGDYS